MSRSLDFSTLRQQLFPMLSGVHYFNAAQSCPLPTPVTQAAAGYWQRIGASADIDWRREVEHLSKLRARLAHFVGADTSEIVLVDNATVAANYLALMLKEKNPPGEIVCLAEEFPSSVVPWRHHGFKLVMIDHHQHLYPLAKILQHLSPQTQAVVCSLVHSNTGLRVEIEKLAPELQKRGIPLLLNVTQALGSQPIDIAKLGCQALWASGHKYLMAGPNAGLLYLQKDFFAKLRPPVAGWLSLKPEAIGGWSGEWRGAADMMEITSINRSALHRLDAALDVITQVGIDTIWQRVQDLAANLRQQLRAAGIGYWLDNASGADGGSLDSGITFIPMAQPLTVYEELRKKNIWVTPRAQGIRAAVHFFNDDEDIKKLVKELTQVTSSSSPSLKGR